MDAGCRYLQDDSEVTYKDGKPEGLGTTWHENGHALRRMLSVGLADPTGFASEA